MATSLSCAVVHPRGDHTHTVILLHGRDSTAIEFSKRFFESEASGPPDEKRTLPDLFPNIKWVFPQTEALQCDLLGTQPMAQWFDMWSTEDPDERSAIQLPGLKDSICFLSGVVEQEEQIVSRDRIFLGGISQGFATWVFRWIKSYSN